MKELLERIGEIGIVPVVVLNDVKDAEPLAQALCDGGLPCAEVTFRTDAAEESIRRRRRAFRICWWARNGADHRPGRPGSGGRSEVYCQPGLNPKIVKYCNEKGVLIIPGCANPSDVEQAIENGLSVVKFFPAEQAGGLNYIKAIAAPYTGLKFMPTGGINPKNVRSYLAYDKILACGGSWIGKRRSCAGRRV